MLYFVRHGSTDWNENKDGSGAIDPICQGRTDIPLNSKGLEQAEVTYEKLKDKFFDRVICSPLTRAKQTCEIVYRGNVRVEIDDRIIERDFGEFEGKRVSEFDFNSFWLEENDDNYKRAETVMDFKNRVYDFIDELYDNPKQDVLIVSHGGVGGVFVSYFKGIPEDGNYLSYLIKNGEVLMIDLETREFKII